MPGVAATLVAVRRGVRSEPVLVVIGLAGSGVAAMLAFWVYYLLPGLGSLCAYGLFFGSVGVAAWLWPGLSPHRALLRRIAVPLGLWALASLFVVFFGFVHGGAENPLATGSLRFATEPSPFASDSSIPLFFSDWLYAGSSGPVPVFPPEWLLSDRPPLQIGYVLSERSFGWDVLGLHYQLLGVILQQLWVVGMWALLSAARVSGRTRALVMVGALVSDVAIANSFYVWPKLLGAAFVLAALALVVAPGRSPLKATPATTVLLGVLAALAFLSHGTSAFGLIPLAAIVLWRGLPSWRWVAAGAVAVAVLVGPWMAFQHYENPPGNRLAKWSLAGVVEIDGRGTLETLADAYDEAGIEGTIDNKWQNFLTMAGGNPAVGDPPPGQFQFGDVGTEIGDAASALADGNFDLAVSKVREVRHWHLLWTLGILLIGLPLIAFGRLRGVWREGDDWRFARFCLIVFGIGALGWGLLMFGSVAGRAVVTSGSLALPLIAIAGVVAGLRATYPRWAGWLVGANVFTVALLYLPSLAPTLGDSYSAFELVGAVAALAGFFALCFPLGATGTPADD